MLGKVHHKITRPPLIILEILLRKEGIDVNKADKSGITALMLA